MLFLQVKRGQCSLHFALYHALLNNKDEFVYSFIEKVDMKTFLDRDCLDHLYDQVSEIAFLHILKVHCNLRMVVEKMKKSALLVLSHYCRLEIL